MKTSTKVTDYRYSHLAKGKDYDKALSAGDFNTYMAEREDEILKHILPQLYPNSIPRHLDFASGTGRIVSLVEKMSTTSIGLDVSESMMEQAKQKCKSTQFITGDITEDNLDIEPVDLVTAFRFFGNAQDELRHNVLSELRKLIVSGGYLIINNHRNPYSLHELLLRLKGDFPETDLSYWKLKSMLTEHGFKLVRTIGIGLWVYKYSLKQVDKVNVSKLRVLEPVSRFSLFGPFCPDAILIAKRY